MNPFTRRFSGTSSPPALKVPPVRPVPILRPRLHRRAQEIRGGRRQVHEQLGRCAQRPDSLAEGSEFELPVPVSKLSDDCPYCAETTILSSATAPQPLFSLEEMEKPGNWGVES
jgi:hypothetical protein